MHGVAGTIGALLTGVFATAAVTGDEKLRGLIEGNFRQFVNQGISVLASAAIAAVGTMIILKILDATMGLRVTQEEEVQGLDLSQHGEEGYIFR